VNGRYLYSNKIYAENVWELKGPPGERQKEQFLFLVTIPALPSITPPWRGAQLKKSAGTTLPFKCGLSMRLRRTTLSAVVINSTSSESSNAY